MKNKKRIVSIISLMAGMAIFGVIFLFLDISSLKEIYQKSQPVYLIPYAIFTTIVFFLMSFKLKYILKTHDQKVSFSSSLRYTLAGFAVSYITPSARIGGEPLKAYMMKKENKIPFRIGGSSVIIDKFIEFFGIALVAIVGFFLLFFIQGISLKLKIILFSLIFIASSLLFFIYYWTIRGKGPFTTLFNLLRFYKIKKFKKAFRLIANIEKRMEKFFNHHKKEFIISFLIYGLIILAGLLEFKFLLMALGVKGNLTEIILAHVVMGITNFLPVPAGLGFQEAGHSGLFAIIRNSAGLGLLFSLIIRIRNLIVTGIGFIIIANFSSKEIIKNYYEKKNKNSKKK